VNRGQRPVDSILPCCLFGIQVSRSVSKELAVNMLMGSVWHTTSRDRYNSIITDGFIRTNPGISDSERWKTSGGPETFPFVRHIGGLSLFDLRSFDPEAYTSRYPASSWSYFIPVHLQWNESVWVKIDQEKIGMPFISASDLLLKWKADSAYKHAIMPNIEACSLVNIPTTLFTCALLMSRLDDSNSISLANLEASSAIG
jgi:hypothetical protein